MTFKLIYQCIVCNATMGQEQLSQKILSNLLRWKIICCPHCFNEVFLVDQFYVGEETTASFIQK